MKRIVLCFLLIITLPVKAEVSKCTSEEMTRLKELAKNVELVYEPYVDLEVDDVHFKIKALNMDKDLKILLYSPEFYDVDINVVNPTEDEEFIFSEGEEVSFKIVSYSPNLCTNKLLRTINITFPYKNYYYDTHKEKCNGYSEFKYCNEYIDTINSLSDSEIDKLFEEYLNDNKEKIIDIKIKGNNNIYLYIGISLVSILVVVFIIIKVSKNKKERI